MLTRTSKQCPESYHNYLKPSLSRGPITDEEADKIQKFVALHGKKWAVISRQLPGRSDNAIKNWLNASVNRKKNIRDGMRDMRANSEVSIPVDSFRIPLEAEPPSVNYLNDSDLVISMATMPVDPISKQPGQLFSHSESQAQHSQQSQSQSHSQSHSHSQSQSHSHSQSPPLSQSQTQSPPQSQSQPLSLTQSQSQSQSQIQSQTQSQTQLPSQVPVHAQVPNTAQIQPQIQVQTPIDQPNDAVLAQSSHLSPISANEGTQTIPTLTNQTTPQMLQIVSMSQQPPAANNNNTQTPSHVLSHLSPMSAVVSTTNEKQGDAHPISQQFGSSYITDSDTSISPESTLHVPAPVQIMFRPMYSETSQLQQPEPPNLQNRHMPLANHHQFVDANNPTPQSRAGSVQELKFSPRDFFSSTYTFGENSRSNSIIGDTLWNSPGKSPPLNSGVSQFGFADPDEHPQTLYPLDEQAYRLRQNSMMRRASTDQTAKDATSLSRYSICGTSSSDRTPDSKINEMPRKFSIHSLIHQ